MKATLEHAREYGATIRDQLSQDGYCWTVASIRFSPAQLDAFAARIRADESTLNDLTIRLLQDTSAQLRLDVAEAWAARDAMRDERDAEQERCAVLADSMQHAELCTPVNVAEAIRKGALVEGVCPERK